MNKKTSILPVSDLTSTQSATELRLEMFRLPGIVDVTIDFNTGKINVSFDASQIDVYEIVSYLKRVGYDVTTSSINLTVSGLQNHFDAHQLEKTLKITESVLDARVDFITGSVHLKFITGTTNTDKLSKVIQKAGFKIVQSKNSIDSENIEVNLQTEELLFTNKLLKEEINKLIKEEEEARVAEEKFQDIFDHSLVGISIATADGKIKTNEAFRQMLGYSADELSKKTGREITHQDDIDRNQKIIDSIYSGEKDFDQWEKRYIHKNGNIVWAEISTVLRRDEEGIPKHLIAFITNITNRKNTENELLKLNRTYAVISQINKLIFRTHDRDTLFEELCQIAVEYGKFQMAWFGLVDQETSTVIPVHISGHENGYITTIEKISIADTPEGLGPTGTSIREGRSIVCNDIATDISMKRWKDEALICGYHSSISLPIKQFGEVIGAFCLYASVPDFFVNEEIILLEDVANDISFALDAIETEKQRIETEKALTESKETYQMLFESINDAIMISELKEDGSLSKFIRVNDIACQRLGYTQEELLSKTSIEINSEKARITLKSKVNDFLQNMKGCTETEHVTKDGRIIPVEISTKVTQFRNKTFFISIARDLTERKLAENSLKLSEEKFEKIFRLSPYMVSLTSMDGRVVEVNDSVFETLGYTKDEFIGKTAAAGQLWADLNDRLMVFNRLEQYGSVHEVEVKFRNKAGEIRDFMLSAGIIELNEEKLILGIVHDITERKNAEDNIHKERTLLRTLIDNLPNGVFVKDKEYRKIIVNPMHENEVKGHLKQLGLNSDIDIIGKTDHEVFPINLADEFLIGDKKVIRDGLSILNDEGIGYDVEGNQIYLLVSKIPLRDINGEITGLLGVTKDITERKQGELALQESEAKFRNLFQNTPLPIVYVNAEGVFIFRNKKFMEIIGYTDMDVPTINEWWQKAYPDPIYRQYVIENWGKTVSLSLEKGIDVEPEVYHVCCKDGNSRELIISASNQEGNMLVSFVDITERKHAEEEIREQLDELHRWYDVTLDRESRVLELKHEVNELLKQSGEPLRYESTISDTPEIE